MASVETVEAGRPTGGRSVREYLVGGPPLRMSWGAIFGGTVAALGIWLLLWTLGLALGLSSVEPSAPGSVRGAGLFTGIWSLVTPLVALFIGGMVAARGPGVVSKLGGTLHGLVMWGLTTIAGAYLLVSLVGSVVGGVASAGKAALGAAGQAAAGVAQGAASNPEEAQQAASSLGEKAEALGQQAQQKAEELQSRGEDVKQQVQTGALKAAETSGKVFWGVFGVLLLGLVSAVLGATVGVSRRQRAWAEGEAVPRAPAPEPRRGVVYP
jgi:hypothetical protein